MSKAEVLLFHPDLNRPGEVLSIEDTFPAPGLGYLASELKKNGYSVMCLDSYSFLLSGMVYNQENFVKTALNLIHHNHPKVIGITTISHTRKQCFDIARTAKLIDKEIKVVLGGPYATLMFEQILVYYKNIIDYIVLSEGEESFIQLLKAIEKGITEPLIHGVAFLKNDKICLPLPSRPIKNLNKISFPDYSCQSAISKNGEIPSIGIISSRGCAFECEFCGSPVFWGKMRLRGWQNVTDEIEYFQKIYNTKIFRIHDDTFTFPRNRALKILKEIIRREIKAKFYMHTRIEIVDRELLELFKEAGGKWVYFGLETGAKYLRAKMGKGLMDFIEILQKIEIMKELGLSIGIFILVGYPGETYEDIYDTYQMLHEIYPDDVQCSLTKIQPKTSLYYKAIEMGIHKEEDWLNEEIEHFTFVTEKEKDRLYGFMLLFKEKFAKGNLRTTFEKNPEVINLIQQNPNCETLKKKALKELIGVQGAVSWNV